MPDLALGAGRRLKCLSAGTAEGISRLEGGEGHDAKGVSLAPVPDLALEAGRRARRVCEGGGALEMRRLSKCLPTGGRARCVREGGRDET